MQDTNSHFLEIGVPYFHILNFTLLFGDAVVILLTLPATQCTIERSFSKMRRVKTWPRASMADDRLSGLCMLSVHRENINANKAQFMERVVDKFGRDRRRFQFLFK